MKIDPADERILRAKYLDWCSAKVADRFLELTPDQIYALAHTDTGGVTLGGGGSAAEASGSYGTDHAAEGVSTSAASSSSEGARRAERGVAAVVPDVGSEGGLVYRTLVERLTETLAAQLRLPTFDAWVAAYRSDPGRYESELLGFWRGRI